MPIKYLQASPLHVWYIGRMKSRNYSPLDRLLIQVEHGLTALCTQTQSRRPNPAGEMEEPILTEAQRRASSELMRVNHTGEICAQALYEGQMAMARSPTIAQALAQAAAEETDHLAWTAHRLKELHSRPSYLNFFWYAHAYLIGLAAGMIGDSWSLGFIEETERQVTRHLDNHLNRLPAADTKSRQIIAQMREDEQRHGNTAADAGAKPLPAGIKWLMSLQAKVMTVTAAKI
jgi:3-demethoxyubiquinol 3-hydroxylase